VQRQSLSNRIVLWLTEMRNSVFEKNERVITKIIQAIWKFFVPLVELKTQQNKLSINDLESNCYNHRKEILSAWLHLEHNKNLALMELQRQRAT
jgi:hypothetical protein